MGADPALPARVTVPGPCLALPVPPFLKMKVLTELEVARGQSLGHRGLPPLGRVRLSGPCPAAAQVPAARCPLFPAPPTLSSLPLLLDLRLKPTPHQGHLKGHALYGTAPWALCAPEPSRLCCLPPFVCPDPPLGVLLWARRLIRSDEQGPWLPGRPPPPGLSPSPPHLGPQAWAPHCPLRVPFSLLTPLQMAHLLNSPHMAQFESVLSCWGLTDTRPVSRQPHNNGLVKWVPQSVPLLGTAVFLEH